MQKVVSADPRLRMIVSGLFAASGFAALLYQVAWQRTLFGWFGVDLDSVSVIVSIFMLGLGGGALIGGRLADRFPAHRIRLFAAIEVIIGVFGFFSLAVLDFVGASFSGATLPALVALTFLVFAIPTFAMGATLPILVTELTHRHESVGGATGWLYFANTLGAAGGALAAALVLLRIEGLDGLVVTAAALNVLTALGATLFLGRNPA
jgi:spermidine synthase